jgi:hypothetical protein
MHLIKPGLRHQDLKGIHLPSFGFSWKLKKLCRVDFLVFESWQSAEDGREKNTSNMAATIGDVTYDVTCMSSIP